MKNNSEKLLLIISIIFIILGVGIFLYPSISNYLAEKNHIDIIRNYDDLIVKIDEEKINEEKEKAKIYNENLSGDPVHDPFVIGSGYALPENYKEVLNVGDDGVMGYVEIPKISVYLPIYHGTSDEVLEKGVGHIQNTSVPIGGKSTHSVLTGHTGLPNAELFTRLDELGIGDIFYIHVLDDVLTYKVFDFFLVNLYIIYPKFLHFHFVIFFPQIPLYLFQPLVHIQNCLYVESKTMLYQLS